MNVAHLVPAYRGTVHAKVAIGMSRDAIVCSERRWKHMPFLIDAHGIERVRNMGVRIAYENKADLLLMQDADTFALEPAFGALEPLFTTMEKHGAAAVGAAVVTRNGDRMNAEPARPGESYEGEVGTGIMLINLAKLHDLPRPWFRTLIAPDGEVVQQSEDIFFCRQLKAYGHKVIVDYTFQTGHGYSSVHVSRIDA
jgi:hypothetical protein